MLSLIDLQTTFKILSELTITAAKTGDQDHIHCLQVSQEIVVDEMHNTVLAENGRRIGDKK